MPYSLEWKGSPNFTPGNQTQAYYGQPRSITAGAGHWWNTPEAGATHDGVVSIFLNAARQASAHAVLSARRVTEMVRDHDTAWCTNNANPFTYAIEVDPRIMWKWQAGVSQEQRNLGNEIFETLAEYIADKRYHNIPWKPHKTWFSTQCNPIHWNEVNIRAQQIRAAKDAPPPIPEWIKNLQDIQDVKLQVLLPSAPIINLNNGQQVGSPIPQGTWIDIAKSTKVGGKEYYISSYSITNSLPNGIEKGFLGIPAPVPNPNPSPPKPEPEPEWLKNWTDIVDIDMYTRKESVEVVNLLDGSTTVSIRNKGTKIAIASSTEWMGQKYCITKYSTDKKLPHGIRLVDLDIKPLEPVVDPIQPPEPKPVDPAPTTDALIRENNSLLKQIWERIRGN